MSKLTDFEDLIAMISNPLLKDYMKEAMSCYFSGAHRGCIVLSYIALFDDLVNKLGDIKDVNSDARKIYKEVTKRIGNQDIYENYLLEQLASKNLISELDKDIIDTIKNRRHKSAHPSGHHPSAEEARYVFSEVINKFLSKSSLGTKHIVDRILLRSNNKHFFTSSNITDIVEVVSEEISNIHHEAYPYLIISLVKSYNKNKDQKRTNCSFFLDGLSRLNNNELNEQLAKRLIKDHVDDQDYSDKCLSVISANPEILKIIDSSSLKRFKSILSDKLELMDEDEISTKLSHPSVVLRNITKNFNSNYIKDNFSGEIKALIPKIPYRQGVIKLVRDDIDDLLPFYTNVLMKRAGSNSFDTVNTFIVRFKEIEEKVVDVLTKKQCLEMIVIIIGSAKHGAWDAEEIVEQKFESFPHLKQEALKFIKSDSDDALEIVKGIGINLKEFKKRYLEFEEQ